MLQYVELTAFYDNFKLGVLELTFFTYHESFTSIGVFFITHGRPDTPSSTWKM